VYLYHHLLSVRTAVWIELLLWPDSESELVTEAKARTDESGRNRGGWCLICCLTSRQPGDEVILQKFLKEKYVHDILSFRVYNVFVDGINASFYLHKVVIRSYHAYWWSSSNLQYLRPSVLVRIPVVHYAVYRDHDVLSQHIDVMKVRIRQDRSQCSSNLVKNAARRKHWN
jgi:hypothetical protein